MRPGRSRSLQAETTHKGKVKDMSKNVEDAKAALRKSLALLEADDGSRVAAMLLKQAKGHAETAADLLAIEIDPNAEFGNPRLAQLARLQSS